MVQPTGVSKSIKPVILIVDDDRDSLEMYTFALADMGFQPLMAGNAADAFAQACALRPNVIVTDIALPGDSGLVLARRLRSDPRTTDTSIIILTGHAADSTREQAHAAGCDRFVVKPCPPAALAVEIRRVLASPRPVSDFT